MSAELGSVECPLLLLLIPGAPVPIALFPGSFDPFTLGHLDLVVRASGLFDRIVVAVGQNRSKAGFLPVEQRVTLIQRALEEEGVQGVEVRVYSGLTVDFAVELGATWLVRGLRGASDLDEETAMAATNRAVEASVETLFLAATPRHAHVHARWVREMARAGKDVGELVPPCVARALEDRSSDATPANES